jgi:hypothetical protein
MKEQLKNRIGLLGFIVYWIRLLSTMAIGLSGVASENSSSRLTVEMNGSSPGLDDRVHYDLWIVPGDPMSMDLLLNFWPVAEALGDRAFFTPHMFLYDGIKGGCQGLDGENYCYNLCTNKGRYCVPIGVDGNPSVVNPSGADIVKESLRWICIWEEYGSTNGIGVEWWAYVSEFHVRCAGAEHFADENCIADVYKHAKIDASSIDLCMANSGGTEKNQRNTKLDTEISLKSQLGVAMRPSAYVDSSVIRDQLSVSRLFDSICAGYKVGSKPPACELCVSCSDVPNCLKRSYSNAGAADPEAFPQAQGISTHTFATTILFVVCLFMVLGLWLYKRTLDDMRNLVYGRVSDRLSLDELEHGVSMTVGSGMMSCKRNKDEVRDQVCAILTEYMPIAVQEQGGKHGCW